jgi:hypothetical protein
MIFAVKDLTPIVSKIFGGMNKGRSNKEYLKHAEEFVKRLQLSD